MIKKILIYSDAKFIGGHEIQLLSAVKCLKDHYEVKFVINQACVSIKKRLDKMGVQYVERRNNAGRYAFITRFISFVEINWTLSLIKKEDPDLFIVAQGNIERCGAAMIASFISGVKTASYIPVTHYLRHVSSNKLIGTLKDFINVVNFKICCNYITINEFNKNLIIRRNRKAKVVIVRNGLDLDRLELDALRPMPFSINNKGRKIVLIIGRIDFKHKGQDLVLKMIERYKSEVKNYFFLFCGAGNDAPTLKKNMKAIDNVQYFGHVENVASLYAHCDIILIPSIYEAGEGSPMTLLEGLYFNKKIAMSKLPGAYSYLPENSLFEVGSVEGMYQALMSCEAVENKGKINALHNEAQMIDGFLKSVELLIYG